MAAINLGRVKGSTWYSGTADSDAAIKQAEEKRKQIQELEKEIKKLEEL